MSKLRMSHLFNDPAMRPMRMTSRAGKDSTNQNLILQKLEQQYYGDANRRSSVACGSKYDSETDAQIQRYLGAIQDSEPIAAPQGQSNQGGVGISQREMQNMMMKERLRTEMNAIQ